MSEDKLKEIGIANSDGPEAPVKVLIKIYAAIQEEFNLPASIQSFTNTFQCLESLKSSNSRDTEADLKYLKTNTGKDWFAWLYKLSSYCHQGSKI